MAPTPNRIKSFSTFLAERNAELTGTVAEAILDEGETTLDLVRISSKADTIEAAMKLFETIFRINMTAAESQVAGGFSVFRNITEQSSELASERLMVGDLDEQQKTIISGSIDAYNEILEELDTLGFHAESGND